MTSAASMAEPPVDLADLDVQTAVWPVDGFLRRGLAIRNELKQTRADVLILDDIKLAPGTLARLAIKVIVLGTSNPRLGPAAVSTLVEAHPGVPREHLPKNATLLPQHWDPHWYPPLDDLVGLGIPNGAFAVGAVATRADSLLWLVEAGHWLPLDLPIHFLIVVPAGERRRLKRKIRGTMLPQRYHLSERMEQAPSLLASCHLTVMHHDEPIQRAGTLNGLHYGVPFITSMRGTSAPFSLFAHGAEQLAAEVLALYEDRDQYTALAQASRDFGGHSGSALALIEALVDAVNQP